MIPLPGFLTDPLHRKRRSGMLPIYNRESVLRSAVNERRSTLSDAVAPSVQIHIKNIHATGEQVDTGEKCSIRECPA